MARRNGLAMAGSPPVAPEHGDFVPRSLLAIAEPTFPGAAFVDNLAGELRAHPRIGAAHFPPEADLLRQPVAVRSPSRIEDGRCRGGDAGSSYLDDWIRTAPAVAGERAGESGGQ